MTDFPDIPAEQEITGLTPVDQRARRFQVELDGRAWNEIASEVVLKRGLRKGLVLTAKDIAVLLAEDADVRARRAAAILLNTRPRSVGEIQRLLRDRGFESHTVQRVIEHLVEMGGLDDAEFARRYVRHLRKTRPIGPGQVRMRLRRLSVGEEHIASALAEESPEDTERENEKIRKLIEKYLRRLRGVESIRKKQKILGVLHRAGFDGDRIRSIVEEYGKTLSGSVDERGKGLIPPDAGRASDPE